MAVLTMAQAITDALGVAMEKDPRVVLLGEDVGANGGVFRVSDGLFERFGPERVVDTPVAESGIVGTAFGMAVGGLRPVAEIQFMGFSYPAYDQIISHVARIRNRSQHRFTAPMVIRMPFGGGIGAAEHHSESTESIYAHIPGLTVVVPSTPHDAKGLLLSAITSPDPVIFLEPIRLYRSVKEEVPGDWYTVPLGAAEITRPGDDATIITWGSMTKESRNAAERLSTDGIEVEIIDVRTLAPLDIDTLAESVSRTSRAVIVHEAPKSGGAGAEIAAELQARCLYDLEAPIIRVTGWDTVFPLKRSEHQYLPSVERIERAVRKTLEG